MHKSVVQKIIQMYEYRINFTNHCKRRSDAHHPCDRGWKSSRRSWRHPRGRSWKSSWHSRSCGEASKRFECLAKRQIFNGKVKFHQNSCSRGRHGRARNTAEFRIYQRWRSFCRISKHLGGMMYRAFNIEYKILFNVIKLLICCSILFILFVLMIDNRILLLSY